MSKISLFFNLSLQLATALLGEAVKYPLSTSGLEAETANQCYEATGASFFFLLGLDGDFVTIGSELSPPAEPAPVPRQAVKIDVRSIRKTFRY